MSASEAVLWERLRDGKTGFKFRRQHPVAGYCLDFFCAEAKLCIETDGEQHLLREAKDQLRDQRLAELGVLTVRIPTFRLFDDLENCLIRIVRECEERTGRPAFSESSWD